ncbi:MAG: PCRF domain-containing protein, partial [Lachnospiraceae bacterium]|nr:PCRF domain-containing protein [Lachnospiraceae bacterium]
MVELDQIKYRINSYEAPIKEMGEALKLEEKKAEIQSLESQMEKPDFWDDIEGSQEIMRKIKTLKQDVEAYESLLSQKEDIETLMEMGYEENDPELVPEIEEAMESFEKEFEELKLHTLLSGEYDDKDAILTIHAGAGGTESCDWAGMLYRMYSKWAEKKGYSTEVLDYLDGEEAGIKSITVAVKGENAYGYLKSEKGVHRLVRISPFDSSGRRHTS